MIRKFLFVSLIFIYSCSGYSPIYTNNIKSIKFNILQLDGEKKINQQIVSRINSLNKGEKGNLKEIDLNIVSTMNTKVQSKDKKGNPDKYNMTINTELEIIFNEGNIIKKRFTLSDTYNVFDTQFELNKYEKKTMKIMSSKLSERIIIYLQTLN